MKLMNLHLLVVGMLIVLGAACPRLYGAELVHSPDGFSIERPDGWIALTAYEVHEAIEKHSTAVPEELKSLLAGDNRFIMMFDPKRPGGAVNFIMRARPPAEFNFDDQGLGLVTREIAQTIKAQSNADLVDLKSSLRDVAGTNAIEIRYSRKVGKSPSLVSQRMLILRGEAQTYSLVFTVPRDLETQNDGLFSSVLTSLAVDTDIRKYWYDQPRWARALVVGLLVFVLKAMLFGGSAKRKYR